MTLEQLLSPAFAEWCDEYDKNHNSIDHKKMVDEMNVWVNEHQDLLNESVESAYDEIHESLVAAEKAYDNYLNEGMFDTLFSDDDTDFNDKSAAQPAPVVKPVSADDEDSDSDEDSENEPTPPAPTAPGKIFTTNSLKKEKIKNNIFYVINALYDRLEREGKLLKKNSMRFSAIDTSNVVDMTALFAFTNLPNADLSSWNTGKVKHMEGMFYKSSFNNDSICNWDVSSCTDFKNMFFGSAFNKSLKLWNTGMVELNEYEKDADGKPMMGTDGKYIKKTVHAPLPLIGAAEDEEKEYAEREINTFFDNIKDDMDESKMVHIMDFDAFLAEGRVKDFIDKGVNKVKNIFKNITLKIGDFVASFTDDGKMVNAVSPYTSLNIVSSGLIPGVTAFVKNRNEFVNSNVKAKAGIAESSEYYGVIDKNSNEYRNYMSFKKMINESNCNVNNFTILNEDDEKKRVGFSAKEGGINTEDATDITSKQFKHYLEDAINGVPAYSDKPMGAMMIWGAPGIGKTSIPKAVIQAWNESHKTEQKALIVIECAELTSDGFSLPMPVSKSLDAYFKERPKVYDKIKSYKLDKDELEKIKKNLYMVSQDAPQTWLPCYQKTSDPIENVVRNDIANGHLADRHVNYTYDADGKLVADGPSVVETTEGGIIMFDEFFRAKPDIYAIIMQIMLNRRYKENNILGDKWAIIGCSNRPSDDDEVKDKFSTTPPALGNRFGGGQFNFIPDFNDWKKWAIQSGLFDETTLEFLISEHVDVDGGEPEYNLWHTIRPHEYSERAKTIWPTPRTWTDYMTVLYNMVKSRGVSSIDDLDRDEAKKRGYGIVGKDVTDKLWAFRDLNKMNILNVNEIMNDPKYVIPASLTCVEVCDRIRNYIIARYSPENVPTDNEMTNLFNKLNSTYSSSYANNLKVLHIDIIKQFDVFKHKNVAKQLKNYLTMCETKYKFVPNDFK